MKRGEIKDLAERIVAKFIPDNVPFMHNARWFYAAWVRSELVKAVGVEEEETTTEGGETNESGRDRMDRGADAGTA